MSEIRLYLAELIDERDTLKSELERVKRELEFYKTNYTNMQAVEEDE